MPPPSRQPFRIDVAELKSRIIEKLGSERSHRYFSCLNKLLCRKLSKSEFDKLCFLILGRENAALHNQLILSIFRNASQAKIPPPVTRAKDALELSRVAEKKPSSTTTNIFPTSAVIPLWSNGNSRSVHLGLKNQQSSGHDEAAYLVVHQLRGPSDVEALREIGDPFICNLKQSLSHQQELPEGVPIEKQHTEKALPLDRVISHNKSSLEAVPFEVKKVEQPEGSGFVGSPILAPLGVPYLSACNGSTRWTAPLLACTSIQEYRSNYYIGEMCHADDLRTRMQRIAEIQGLEDVKVDCANLLYDGLNAYLRRLIKSCVEVGGRSRNDLTECSVFKQQLPGKVINGMWPGYHNHIPSDIGAVEGTSEQKQHYPLSMQDFRVAMELNPQQLGEDWPVLLKKVYLHSLDG